MRISEVCCLFQMKYELFLNQTALILIYFSQGKHCLLDITPEEVERLNFAQLYPIVIFLRPPNKQMVK